MSRPDEISRRQFLAAGAAALTFAGGATVLQAERVSPTTAAGKRKVPAMTATPLFGPYGSSAIASIDRLVGHGANAIWFHGFNTKVFDACAKHHVAPCVEFKTFRADYSKRPDLVPIGVNGQPIRHGRLLQGVCLSKKDFLDQTEQHLLDGVRQYQPVGIWLDYLSYAGWFETPHPDLQESCFCPDCIADFCEASGVDATTPAEILAKHHTQWTAHKCQRIARFGEHYARIIRRHLPGCIVGAYMCPWTPAEFDGALTRIFAQDYTLLAPAIDVFTPLIYAKKSGRCSNWGCTFVQHARQFVPPDRKVQPILDLLDFPDSLQAVAACPTPAWGLQLFGGAQVFADPAKAKIFADAVGRMRQTLDRSVQ